MNKDTAVALYTVLWRDRAGEDQKSIIEGEIYPRYEYSLKEYFLFHKMAPRSSAVKLAHPKNSLEDITPDYSEHEIPPENTARNVKPIYIVCLQLECERDFEAMFEYEASSENDSYQNNSYKAVWMSETLKGSMEHAERDLHPSDEHEESCQSSEEEADQHFHDLYGFEFLDVLDDNGNKILKFECHYSRENERVVQHFYAKEEVEGRERGEKVYTFSDAEIQRLQLTRGSIWKDVDSEESDECEY